MDITTGESTQKRRERRRAERAVKIGDKACVRERLEGEQSGLGGGGDGGDGKKPQVGCGGFGPGEEREGRSGSVEKTDRSVSKDGMTMGSEERGDADERVGQSRVWEEVARDGRDFVREREFSGDVGGTTDRQDRTVRQGEG